jgi:diguanylate cyclase (GGDEF)-like protein
MQISTGANKMNNPKPETGTSVEQEQLRGYSRIVVKIEAVLLVIVLIALSFEGVDAKDRAAISAALLIYGALVLGLRRFKFHKAGSHARIAAEIWAMIPFISWAIWFTDKLASPLLNAYFIVLISGALMLGMRQTLWQLGLITVCLALLGESFPSDATSWIAYFGNLLMQVTPLILIAYATSVFAPDIRFWMNKAKLGSEIDALTGLHNMRGFSIVADRIFGHAVREDSPTSLLGIDIGDLAGVNETRGIGAGNGLLRSVAKRIETGLRKNDVLARYGENVLMALLPGTSTGGALIAAERIRAAVTGPIEAEGKQLAASVSIGLATFAAGGRGIDAVLMQAERAMHLAREQGGNKVVKSAA